MQADGCSPERAEAALRNLAGLHAPRWNDPTLYHLEFVSGTTPEDAAFFGEVSRSATEEFVERYRHELADEDVATLRASAAAMTGWIGARPEPFSVTHGDYRLDNLMFVSADDDVVAVDWRTVSVGPPLRDLAYFLGTSLDIEVRRAEEQRLVEGYHAELCARRIARRSCAAIRHLGSVELLSEEMPCT